MSVHYKFKSALDFDTVTFDGLNISVGDLKRAIIHQKRLGKVTDFDLQITNAQTKEEYQDDSSLIPKNTSLIIARIPIPQPKKTWNPQNLEKTQQARSASRGDGNSLDLSKMKGSEEDKILEMMLQSTAEYDPKSYHRIRGYSQIGEVPATYRCNKCKKTGHWIKNCPYNLGKDHSDVKRNTGIPRSFLDKDGRESPADFPEPPVANESKKEIPEDLICSICKDLFVDAVMIPCCGSSFCDDCVRSALLESEDNECPDCEEKGCSPGSLIPNRFLRNSVNSFKNENGYTNLRTRKAIEEKATEPVQSLVEKANSDASDIKKLEEIKQTEAIAPKVEPKPEERPKEKEVAENSSKGEISKAEEVESDFEDNITIMMPPVQVKNSNALQIEHSGRSISHPKPPGIENSPHHKLQMSPSDTQKIDNQAGSESQSNEWDHDHKRGRDYSEDDSNGNVFYKNSNVKHHGNPINAQMHYGPNKIQMRPSRPNHLLDVYSGPPNRVHGYQQIPVTHNMPQDPAVQGQPMMPFGVYSPMVPRPNVGYQHSVRPMFHNAPPGFPAIRCPPADIHHGNSNFASVYQGVAAKVGTGIIEDPLETFNRLMKEKERRREERRRSMDRRRSWSNERQHRGRAHASPYRKNSREVKEKLKPNENDRKREHLFHRNKSIRRRRSNSFSDKSSRSRSWSKSPVKKRSRSPYIKRSRSRTHNFQEKQRDTGKNHNIRPEDLHQEFTQPRRSTSEERNRFSRQSNTEWYTHQGQFESERYLIPKRDRFLESQHESVEPPPPGYEPNPTTFNSHYSSLPQNYVKPKARIERTVSDTKDKRQTENRRSSEKTDVKTANKATEKKARRSRSPTPGTKKKTDSSDKPEKNTNKRPRNNFPTSLKSAEKSRPESYHKRGEISFNETIKRTYEKSSEKSSKSTEVANSKDVKHEKVQVVERRSSPEKHKSRRGSIVKEDEIHSNSSKESQDIARKLKGKEIAKKLKEKERKKKRKDKNEKKKLKKDKRSKRERERQKNSTETEDMKQPDEYDETKDNYISRTPELDISKTIFITDNVTPRGNNTTNINTVISLDDNDDVKMKSEESSTDKTKGMDTNTNETEFKRVDSVLDILDYETEFDDLHSQSHQKTKNVAPLPEPSKWEIDDQNNSEACQIIDLEQIDYSGYQDEKSMNEKVTNEVLRKAENAIFARAIKAIYPFDKNDVNIDHQRVFNETLPRIGTKDKIKNFEITVPTSNSQERSVQIKDNKSSHSPKVIKSVKERLGSKITTKYDYSPVRETPNKSYFMKGNSVSDNTCDRSEERNRNKFKDRDRGKRDNREYREYRENRDNRGNRDNRSNRDNRDRNVINKMNTQSNRDVDRDKNRDHVRDQDRQRERERERERIRERELSKYRSKDYAKARDRGRDNVKDNHYKSPRHSSREKDTFSRNIPHIPRGDEEGSHGKITNKGRETTPNHSKDEHKTKKKNSEWDENSAINRNKKRISVSKEDHKNETNEMHKMLNEPESRTHLHNSSACSSSGSINTSSDSDSDDNKRKKKHKYKKEKKRSKRSPSADSVASSKEKHARIKKRNKSSKKKKKNKK